MQNFDEVVRAHADAVHAYARALTSDAWPAEEAVQVTFLRAWKYQDSFRGDGSYEGWLIRICRNVVFALAKKLPFDQSLDQVVERVSEIADTSEAEIGDLLDTLPGPQREALMLCGVMGYDYESAAQILDVPVGTVRSRLHRGRSALSELLAASAAAAPAAA